MPLDIFSSSITPAFPPGAPTVTDPAPDAGPPLHGYRGAAPSAPLTRPRGFTVSISREAGARGLTVARSVGRRLGWQVFPQEMIDFLAHDETARADVLSDLPAGAVEWADAELAKLVADRGLNPAGDTAAVARLVFALAARGDAVLVGRGAGFLLPRESTVHVRIVAPLAERVAYLAQWLRMTDAEAAAEAASRDRRRAAFLGTLTEHPIADPTGYDLFVNSARVGVETIAELVTMVVRSKQLPLAEDAGENEPA